jgi:hypothetical protein
MGTKDGMSPAFGKGYILILLVNSLAYYRFMLYTTAMKRS